ncbi:HAD hydrolase family protein [Desulfobulbus sp. F4]|nr:HAD hydrolase family protein [Desulfobulbus sp. F3]MCW5200376.1 HAD hydrolase family protein [Desulfobulbus sp. F4]
MSRDECDMDGYSDCALTQAFRTRAMEREKPVERSAAWQAALPKAKKVELLLLDVDGVLTDGTVYYRPEAGDIKGFNTQDGFGLRILQEADISVGLITARNSEAVSRRAKDLKIQRIYAGCSNKGAAYAEILVQTGLKPEQTAYMGDDWLDMPVLTKVGCAFAPANAVQEVRQRADYVTELGGGNGAVREVCELILEAKGLLASIFAQHLGCSAR